MIQVICVCSIVSAILNVVLFIKVFTDDAAREGRAAAAAYEVKRLRGELTAEKRRRIQAENDAAFYERQIFSLDDLKAPEFPNSKTN